MEAIESEFLKRNVYEYFKYCYLEKNVCGGGLLQVNSLFFTHRQINTIIGPMMKFTCK